jgi:hypothetical protein
VGGGHYPPFSYFLHFFTFAARVELVINFFHLALGQVGIDFGSTDGKLSIIVIKCIDIILILYYI